MTFNTECLSAKFDEKRAIWVVRLRRRQVEEWEVQLGGAEHESGRGGVVKVRDEDEGWEEEFVHECKVLLTAVGGLVVPNELKIEGSENFEGKMFHSGRWDHTVDVKDKNVVVIGNGCKPSFPHSLCPCP